MGLRGRSNLTNEYLFFITTTVVGFTKVFIKNGYCDVLINNIKHYQNKYKFEIFANVIMPTHFHWIIMVNPEFGNVSDIMRDIKKYSAWDIMEIIEKEDKDLLKIFYDEGLKFSRHKRKLRKGIYKQRAILWQSSRVNLELLHWRLPACTKVVKRPQRSSAHKQRY